MTTFTLGRGFDLSNGYNRLLLILFVLLSAGGALISGSLLQGLGIGGGFFFSWALAREIDPLHPTAAFVAAGVFLLSLPWYDGLSFGALFWLVLMLRMMTRICGKIPTNLDLAVLFGLSGWLAWSGKDSVILLLLGAGLLVAYSRYGKQFRWAVASLVGAAAYLAGSFIWHLEPGWLFSLDPTLRPVVLGTAAVLGAGLMLAFRKAPLAGDDLGQPVPNRWLQHGRGLFVLTTFAFMLAGPASGSTVALLLAVQAGVLAHRVWFSGRERLKREETD